MGGVRVRSTRAENSRERAPLCGSAPSLPTLPAPLRGGGDGNAQAQLHTSCPGGSHGPPPSLKGPETAPTAPAFPHFCGGQGAQAQWENSGGGSGRVSSCSRPSRSRQSADGTGSSAAPYINWKRKVCELRPQVWGYPGLAASGDRVRLAECEWTLMDWLGRGGWDAANHIFVEPSLILGISLSPKKQ